MLPSFATHLVANRTRIATCSGMAERCIKAPLGFIDLRHAIGSMRGRMYLSGVPAWVLKAAEEHVRPGATFKEITRVTEIPIHPTPIALIIEALQSENLRLFA